MTSNNERKEIDLKTYKKRNQFNWFKTFDDPTYGFDVKADVTEIVKLSKERKESFFIYFLFAIMNGVNSVYEMKLREENNTIYQYDIIHPTFTVMTDEGVYQNTGCLMDFNFDVFYKRVRKTIDTAKHLKVGDDLDRYEINKLMNVVYLSSLPNLSIISMRHPIPSKNYESMSVPRIFFDKYIEEGDKYYVTLNITVSHTLVDGYPLAACFNKIIEFVNNRDNFKK